MSDTETATEGGVKQELLDVLRRHHGEVKLIEHRPKQRSKYEVTFDQGVFKGQNVTAFNYQHLDPLFVATILASEYPSIRGAINDLLLDYFRKEMK